MRIKTNPRAEMIQAGWGNTTIVRRWERLMAYDNHLMSLGKLVADLQSLEFLLRMVLQSLPAARQIGIEDGDIYSFSVGSAVPESEMTSYESLGQLINNYNREMASRKLALLEDAALVRLRDALAHGRVSAPRPSGTLRLVKFGKPKDGKVKVLFNEEMSCEWFSSQTKRVFDAIGSVVKNAEMLKLDVTLDSQDVPKP